MDKARLWGAGGICFSAAIASAFAFQSMITSARASGVEAAISATISDRREIVHEKYFMTCPFDFKDLREGGCGTWPISREAAPRF
ncbi:hypothetical protein [Bradyrhizobium sp. AZCC 2230]|uniref:hypothetical protein n=1 Tax=Bradyrhizobium sp. AZCC 2230 TaxID=3117021 RepID=UPI002FF35F5F